MPMFRHVRMPRHWIARFHCLWVFFLGVIAGNGQDFSALINLAQLRPEAHFRSSTNYRFQLEADVWWADAAANRLILHDESGTSEVELELTNQVIQAGQRIRLTGDGTIVKTAHGFRLGVIGPVVDNNGVHVMTEKSGSVYLSAGRQPIRLDWFNGMEDRGLVVEYAGPGLPRQPIPDDVLFHWSVDGGAGHWVAGLKYSAYVVTGEVLPDFSRLVPLKGGVVSNFDLGVLTRTNRVGLEFTGHLDVPRAGLYTFYTKSDDGSQLFVGHPHLQLQIVGNAKATPEPRPMALGQALTETRDFQWVRVEGTVTFVSRQEDDVELELSSGTGRIRVIIAESGNIASEQLLNRRVRATGVCLEALTTDGQRIADTLLVPGMNKLKMVSNNPLNSPPATTNSTNAPLPTLTTAAEVHRLKREQAERGYPVKIQGVVTCVLPENEAFTLQDATRGIYVEDHSIGRGFLPQIGEFLEVSGTSDPSKFAPIVKASHWHSFGAGHLPEPVRPTWDQLLNGSLDAQYVELQGIITATSSTNVTLLTRDGRIKAELRVPGMNAESLQRYEDALVRVRGCLFANWDYVTHEVRVGEIRIFAAAISVDQPAPKDPFAIPSKTVADLLLFDPQASVFQRVKVSGQVEHVRDSEGFLTDGQNGLRFFTKRAMKVGPGDLVEVVGFPELSGASPVLREAVVRKIGHASLPAPKKLPTDELTRMADDATLVKVKGVLVSARKTASEWILEIQNGVRTFAARVNTAGGEELSLPAGSLLELTGVYSSLGAGRVAGQDISTFELLLNSPADITVLARPPWWTLERMLIMLGALLCVLAVTVLWITQLRRKVEQRTAELEVQIQQRQQLEQQRAMEQERARVAQDLHDELGSSLTEISMLGARARAVTATDEKRKQYLNQMSDTARDMVAALDEIVWAMNPRHDSLSSLVSYFCLYADRFLGLAGISWRLDNGALPDDFVVDSRHRHQLFLAFKEALTNVVRHSGATEVRLNIRLVDGEVRLSISDNGHGLPAESRTEEMDGVANMRARLEKLGGRFDLNSEPGQGTTLRFSIPAR